ncbi:hypothetical protein [Streptomyces sp. NPDC002599]|uniref:hypothetical protein n=1 Tax=Streptomyces sp. NPDC002599 TaxID=3154421 RepID=UPI0033278B06
MVEVRDWSTAREVHPHLCENCQDQAVAAEQQAEAGERERQDQAGHRQEQKAGGWFGCRRT